MAKPLTTAEHMAVAVLQGDLAAARQLADLLLDQTSGQAVELPPIQRLRVDRDRLRLILYTRDGEWEQESVDLLDVRLSQWLAGTTPYLLLADVERVEVYEMGRKT